MHFIPRAQKAAAAIVLACVTALAALVIISLYEAPPAEAHHKPGHEKGGRTSAPAPACADSKDNDADGKTDYPADPGCTSATGTDETDPPVPPSEANPFADKPVWLRPDTNARKTADSWYAAGRTADAQQMEKIAQTPQVMQWYSHIHSESLISSEVTQATDANSLPVMVLYDIPYRDCGGYSEGGVSANSYRSFIDYVTRAIGTREAVVILEPDALAMTGCLSPTAQQERYALLNYAVDKLKSNPHTYVYMDAGNSAWQPVSTMVDRLNKAGIQKADGFSLDVSNFQTTSNLIAYGKQISGGVGGKHMVLDTSRNGLGPYPGTQPNGCPYQYNPPGRALGERSSSNTADPLVDAYVWIKYPGESDGSCGGFPSAGTWMPEYALDMAKRTPWTAR